jgi:hypothetical protein
MYRGRVFDAKIIALCVRWRPDTRFRPANSHNLIVIIQTIDRRSIQLIELQGRRSRRWFEKKRNRGSRVPQPSGFEVQ